MNSSRWMRKLNLKVLVAFGFLSVVLTFITLKFGVDPGSNADKGLPSLHIGQSMLDMQVKETQSMHNSGCKTQPEQDTRPFLSVPRIAKYCNVPNSGDEGAEGLVPRDLTLLSVHVVIRHGDRAPLINLKDPTKPSTEEEAGLSCLVDVNQLTGHVPKLENYLQVMALADADGTKPFPEFKMYSMHPDQAECQPGQLTGRGAIQQVLNGIHLSQRYTQSPHNLPITAETLRAFSTSTSRTYQSALAFLYGLLPSFDTKLIRLEKVQKVTFCDEDSTPGSVCTCPGVERIKGKAVVKCQEDTSVVKSREDYQSTAAQTVSEIFGLQQERLPPPDAVMDALSKYACHSIAAPCTFVDGGVEDLGDKGKNITRKSCPTFTKCLTAKTFEGIWGSVDELSRCLHENADFKKFAIASSQGLLLRIAAAFNRTISKKGNDEDSEPVFVLYSGHDNTLTPLMVALGLQDYMWPGYASRLVFELYRQAGSEGRHYIRIIFNGKAVTSQTLFCRAGGLYAGLDDVCELERFHGFVTHLKVQEFCAALRSVPLISRMAVRKPQ